MGLLRFLGGIIIHYRSHRSFSTLARLSVSRRCPVSNNNGGRFGYSIVPFFDLRTTTPRPWPYLAACTSVFSSKISRIPLGDGCCCRPRFVESTDSNNLGVDFLSSWLSRLARFVYRRKYYTTTTQYPPLFYIDWSEGLDWGTRFFLVVAGPAITLLSQSRLGCLIVSFCRLQKHHHTTYHIPSLSSSGFLIFLFLLGGEGVKGGGGGLVGIFTSVLSFIIDITTPPSPCLIPPFLFSSA